MKLIAAAIALGLSILAPAANAQAPVATPTSVDTSSAEEGARAGIAAADEQNIAGRVVSGFVGGLPVGFFLPMTVIGSPVGLAGTAVGITVVEASGRLGRTAPQPSPALQNRSDAFKDAYTISYRNRLIGRRKTAARFGGLAGTIVGACFYVWIVSSITT